MNGPIHDTFQQEQTTRMGTLLLLAASTCRYSSPLHSSGHDQDHEVQHGVHFLVAKNIAKLSQVFLFEYT